MEKKILLLIIHLVVYLPAIAQWQPINSPGTDTGNIYHLNGNVGIGTATPSEKLEVYDGRLKINSGASILHFHERDMSQNWFVLADGGRFSIRTNTTASSNEVFSLLNNGNTGMGILNPSEKLELNGNLRMHGDLSTITFRRTTNAADIAKIRYDNNGAQLVVEANNKDIVFNSKLNFDESLRITSNGRLGLGTSDPVEAMQLGDRWTFHNGGSKIIGYNFKYTTEARRIVSDEASNITLDASGNIAFKTAPTGAADSPITFINAMTITNNGDIAWGGGSLFKRAQGGSIELGDSGTPYIDFRNDSGSDYDVRFVLVSDNAMQMLGGNLLIGKSSQTNSTYKIDVEGKIRASEIVVNTDGADYVFDPTYKLTPLQELETYIRINRHLPGIASADEMQRDGMGVAETTTMMLEKIEELTLYLIEIKKENERQQEQLTQQQQEMNLLRRKIREQSK